MHQKGYIKHIFGLLTHQKKTVTLFGLLILLDTAIRLTQPYLFKIVVDTLNEGLIEGIFTADTFNFLIFIVGIWFVLSIFNTVFHAKSTFLGWKISMISLNKTFMQGYQKLLRMDYKKHTEKHSSKYSKIVDEAADATWQMTEWWLNRIIPSIIGFTGMFIIAIGISWQMTLVSVSIIPIYLAIIIFVFNKYGKEQHRVNKLWTHTFDHMSDQISNIITYKLNQDETRFYKIQERLIEKASNEQVNINKKWQLTTLLNPDVFARFMVLGLGVFLVKDGSITLGTLFMFMSLLTEILGPLHLLTDIIPQYNRKSRQIEKVLMLIAEPEMIKDQPSAKKPRNVKGKLELQNIHFKYDIKSKKSYAIKNLSLKIAQGEHVAFVGHSGAGKSTLVGLITRLYDPQKGKILLDGKNIKELKQADYRKHIGTVLQEHSMYDDTIAYNIAYGKRNATRKEIIAASKKARAHEFIIQLPKKYDTIIGEKGVKLSGGQKQRISIARAILKNPRIVILDEPTSALDSITEEKVQKGLKELINGRTTITIAHRLATVKDADRIIILKNGAIKQMGSHKELLKQSPDYRTMVQLQTSGFLADE